MIGNVLLALCFMALGVAIGWLGFLYLIQQRDMKAAIRTLKALTDRVNAIPALEGHEPVQVDPDLPEPEPLQAPVGVESFVRAGAAGWREWDTDDGRRLT